MGTDPSAKRTARDQVAQWLELSGAALELRVAREFRRPSARDVSHSRYYRIEGEDREREVDVKAVLRRRLSLAGVAHDVEVVVIVECKATSEPWVLYRHASAIPPGRHVLRIFHLEREDVQLDSVVGFESAPLMYEPAWAYQLASTHNNGKGQDKAYNALRQVRSAVAGVRQERIPLKVAGIRIYVPVIVTTSPLFAVELGDGQEIDIEPVERMMLVSSEDGRSMATWVVNESGLVALVNDADATLNSFSLQREPVTE